MRTQINKMINKYINELNTGRNIGNSTLINNAVKGLIQAYASEFVIMYNNMDMNGIYNHIQEKIGSAYLNQVGIQEVQRLITLAVQTVAQTSNVYFNQPIQQPMFNNNFNQPFMQPMQQNFNQPIQQFQPVNVNNGIKVNSGGRFGNNTGNNCNNVNTAAFNNFNNSYIIPDEQPIQQSIQPTQVVQPQTQSYVTQPEPKEQKYCNNINIPYLLAKGIYMEKNELCGEAKDSEKYQIKESDSEITFEELKTQIFIGNFTDKRMAYKFKCKVNDSFIRELNGSGNYKRLLAKLNLLLIGYTGNGTFDCITDYEETKNIITDIKYIKVREELKKELEDNVALLNNIDANIKNGNKKQKIEYSYNKQFTVIQNPMLWETLNVNTYTVLELMPNAYDNLYELLEKSEDEHILLYQDGVIKELVFRRDVRNSKSFLVMFINNFKEN